MNLVCPHCQKMVTVPEQQAGQMTSCPSCEQKFLVPSLAPSPDDLPKFDLPADVPLVPLPPSEPATRPHAPEPAEHEGGVYNVAPEPARPRPVYETRREERPATPPRASSSAPAATPRAAYQPPPVAAPSGTTEGYEHTTTFTLNPRVLPIVALAALVLLFFLLFFSWTGAFPGGYSVYTQNAWQMVWGGHSVDPVGEEALGGTQPFETDNLVGANPLMWLYFLLFFACLIMAVAPLVLQKTTFKLPPALQDLWPWRQAILGGALLLTFLILILQGSIGFGLERAIRRQVEKSLESEREAANTPEKIEKVKIKEGVELGRFNIHRTTAFRLAFLVNFVALACVGLELWLSRRATKPLPRMDLYW
jgi:hypothetical protein